MATFTAESSYGAQLQPVQLGLGLGGLITTWSPDSRTPQLWAISDAGALTELMYRGKISKVGRGEGYAGRYREAAMLDTANQTLSVTVDGESEPRVFALSEPVDINGKQTSYDIIGALKSAIQSVSDGKTKMVLLERGGLDAPKEPFALCTIEKGQLIVETRPTPQASETWSKIIKPNSSAGFVSTPVSEKAIGAAALLMAEAARTWGITPWDLALTYQV